MGLDQYAHRQDSNGEDVELANWRKHNALQGWMENLWTLKSGKPANELNCEVMELTAEDLENLRLAVEGGKLPVTVGFFFGDDTSKDLSRLGKDLDFVDNALKAIDEGDKVFYSCWW
jgi:hypothetical protein|tara:strand:+ start:1219 stop:1569 length:351 start_codon:yes stop_codon:yes gene_type:complete